MKKYRWIQGIAAVYGMIYVAALYYASGVHTGFKLDDHQLTGYVICGLFVGVLGMVILGPNSGPQTTLSASIVRLLSGTTGGHFI